MDSASAEVKKNQQTHSAKPYARQMMSIGTSSQLVKSLKDSTALDFQKNGTETQLKQKNKTRPLHKTQLPNFGLQKNKTRVL
jgi:hypothetical protein